MSFTKVVKHVWKTEPKSSVGPVGLRCLSVM